MNSRRFTAFILSLIMVLTLLPVGVFAEGEPEHRHCICGTTHESIGTHTAKDVRTFTAWTDSTTMPAIAGNYYLDTDVTLTSSWEAPEGTVLCLNGYTITNTNGSNKVTPVILIHSGTIIITDCCKSGVITHFKQSYGRGIQIDSGATGMLFGITIQNCIMAPSVPDLHENGGGGIYTTGNLTISGCKILNCATNRGTSSGMGGAICTLANGETVLINNTIIDNCSAVWGTAICDYNGCIITITNSKITKCKTATDYSNADGCDGAIETKGTLTLENVEITECSTVGYASAIKIFGTSPKVYINSNCNISGNTGKNAIRFDSGTLNISGDNINIIGNTYNDQECNVLINNISKYIDSNGITNSTVGISATALPTSVESKKIGSINRDATDDKYTGFISDHPNFGIIRDRAELHKALKAEAPSASSISGIKCTDVKNIDGKITGVNSTMEYRVPGLSWYDCRDRDIEWLSPGTYEVRTKAHDACLPSDPIEVTVEAYVGTKEPLPDTARFDAVSMKLVGVENGWKYKIALRGALEPRDWTTIRGKEVNLGDIDRAHTIYVMHPSNETTTLDSDTYITYIDVCGPVDTSDVVSNRPSVNGASDGSFTGLPTSIPVEYKKSGDSSWTSCSGSSITGLEAGSYEIREKAHDHYLTGPVTTLTIYEGYYNHAVTVSAFSGTYDGSAHEAVAITGTVSDAAIHYGTVEGTYNLPSVPSYTNAGSYPVYYKITASGYNDLTGSAIATIAQKNVSGASVSSFGALTYSGSAQTPSAAVTIDGLAATGSWSNVINVADKTTFTADGNFTGTIAGQNPGMQKKTADALSLDTQVTAPVKNGTPQTVFDDHEQYTGTISWVSDPAKFLGGISYIAELQLTATDNYSIDGVSFTYAGASYISTSGGAVTITFAETAAPVVTSIAITAPADKTSYLAGEPLDIAGLGITATYDDDTTTVPAVTADMVAGFNSSAAAAGQTLTVTYEGCTDTYTVDIVLRDAPSGLTAVRPSVLGEADGSITGVTTSMEYRASGAPVWTACTGTTIAGLAAGSYEVRLKEDSYLLPGAAASVEVPAGYPNMDISASNYNADYDGAAHTITVTGAPSGADITYSIAADGTFGADPIEFTDFTDGPQTVYFKASATGYNNFEGSATVNITKLDIAGAEVGSFGALTYAGSAQKPAASVTKSGLAVTGSWSNVTNVADKTTFTADGNFTGSIADQSTGMAKAVVTALNLSGLVTAPAKNGVPQSSVADQAQYTGTISWASSPAKFLGETVYTATITLTATANYTLTGVAENAFAYTGASAENAADSGVVTITFPATGAVAASSAAITSAADKTVYKIGEELDTAGLEITVTYDDGTTTVPAIAASMLSGFDSSAAGTKTVTITFEGVSASYDVEIEKLPVDALDLSALVTVPVKNAAPQTDFSAPQYSGSISWSGTPDHFLGGTAYTATVTLTAAEDYTFDEIEANAFGHTSADSVSNAAGSGVVTITFPATSDADITGIAVGTPASKTSYKVGDALDTSGMTITVSYDDGTNANVPVTADMVTGFDSSAAAESQTLTVSYAGFTVDYTVSISKKSSGSHKPAPAPVEPEQPLPADPTSSFPFTDVKENAYFRSAVEWAVDNGITSGVSKDKFGAGQNCSRAQMITFLWIAAGKPEVDANIAFKDVPAGAYYEKAVKWAYATGITAGVSKDMFGINRAVTRAQTVTYLWALAGRPDAAANGFTDVNSSDYFAKAAEWAKSAGITAGIGNGKFGPNNECLREQIITFMYNYFN